jgi:hypothetical protein
MSGEDNYVDSEGLTARITEQVDADGSTAQLILDIEFEYMLATGTAGPKEAHDSASTVVNLSRPRTRYILRLSR